MEQLAISSEQSLCFGLISMQLCGYHILSLSSWNFDTKCVFWIPSLVYIILRLLMKAQGENSIRMETAIELKQLLTGLCLDPLSFFATLMLTLHIHRYDQT